MCSCDSCEHNSLAKTICDQHNHLTSDALPKRSSSSKLIQEVEKQTRDDPKRKCVPHPWSTGYELCDSPEGNCREINKCPLVFLSPIRWLFNETVCMIYAFCGVLFGLCSLTNLTVLSCVCWLKVCCPNHGKTRTFYIWMLSSSIAYKTTIITVLQLIISSRRRVHLKSSHSVIHYWYWLARRLLYTFWSPHWWGFFILALWAKNLESEERNNKAARPEIQELVPKTNCPCCSNVNVQGNIWTPFNYLICKKGNVFKALKCSLDVCNVFPCICLIWKGHKPSNNWTWTNNCECSKSTVSNYWLIKNCTKDQTERNSNT